jgi:hypothetical protein
VTTPRPLPRGLDPLPDESIVGFVLRLARRLEIPPARVVELTGLNTGHRSSTSALGLAVHVVPAARHAFAHATRLTAAETDNLFLSALGDRYPAAQPSRGPNRWGSTTYFDRWLFTRSTRYCPACLTGEDTELGRALGGAWRRTWRLPVVFACTEHRRYLDHQCPACRQLAATPDLIDYDRRRAALRGDWCIDTETWRWIADQLPPPEWIHGRQPQLGDRKRQSASIYVWARVTGTEHVFAPHPLRDQQPAEQQGAWRISDYAFWARFQKPCTRPHDIALRTLLDDYASRLATHIDRTGHANHERWTGTSLVTLTEPGWERLPELDTDVKKHATKDR